MTFAELGLNEDILRAIEELGFEKPSEIQEKSIPILLDSYNDYIGLAQTGTGKTAAFGLPLVDGIDVDSNKIQGLIVCPTRELCLQIKRDLDTYSKYTKIKSVAVYGGTPIDKQIRDLRRGTQIVVATPGRLLDLLKRKALKFDGVEKIVLDEADEMLNMGFKEDIDAILSHTPDDKNVWLFSATMPREVEKIASNYMTDPKKVTVGSKNEGAKNIEHHYYCVKEKDRYPALKRVMDFLS